MKNKIANQPKLPVMEGESKTGSGATANKMAVMAVVLKLSEGVFPILSPGSYRFPEDPGEEVGSVPCLRRAVSSGNVTPTAI